MPAPIYLPQQQQSNPMLQILMQMAMQKMQFNMQKETAKTVLAAKESADKAEWDRQKLETEKYQIRGEKRAAETAFNRALALKQADSKIRMDEDKVEAWRNAKKAEDAEIREYNMMGGMYSRVQNAVKFDKYGMPALRQPASEYDKARAQIPRVSSAGYSKLLGTLKPNPDWEPEKDSDSEIRQRINGLVKRYGPGMGLMGALEVLEPRQSKDKFIGWLKARSIEKKRGMKDLDLRAAEQGIMSSLKLPFALQQTISMSRLKGATDAQLIKKIRGYSEDNWTQ